MRICLRDLADTGLLAGAELGRRVLAKLMECAANEAPHPEPLFLDFQKVEIATASFLREAILNFRDVIRKRRSNFYPVVANANTSVLDDLRVLIVPQGDAFMVCTLTADGKIREPHLEGNLDPKQRITFDLVRKHGETDASELMRDYGKSEQVQQTAWNNRLATLANLGLIIELSYGRAKRYRPLLGEN